MAGTATATTTRLSKQARREQLLDSAADLLLAEGIGSLTMEGLAARAGVSKALPYAHFDNADDVVAELHQREITRLAARVLGAIADLDDGVERIAASVTAYFDVVQERGAILGALTGAAPVRANPDRTGHEFVADLLQSSFPMRRKSAMAAAVMTQTLLTGAVEAWVRGDASRSAIEAMAVRAIVALATADA